MMEERVEDAFRGHRLLPVLELAGIEERGGVGTCGERVRGPGELALHEQIVAHAANAQGAIERILPVGYEGLRRKAGILQAQPRVAGELTCQGLEVDGEALVERRRVVGDGET